ncbi:MAG: hypothetical protein NTW87_14560 [Planctomycetota bacterium]|nr:hypothetical protein [Planctomycetota bacterium]
MPTRRKTQQTYLICVNNTGCDDLQVGKIYRVEADASAAGEGFIRVVDESGEDYLYPTDRFVPIQLPPAAKRALSAAQHAHRTTV